MQYSKLVCLSVAVPSTLVFYLQARLEPIKVEPLWGSDFLALPVNIRLKLE
jgi:hypothetical protein